MLLENQLDLKIVIKFDIFKLGKMFNIGILTNRFIQITTENLDKYVFYTLPFRSTTYHPELSNCVFISSITITVTINSLIFHNYNCNYN